MNYYVDKLNLKFDITAAIAFGRTAYYPQPSAQGWTYEKSVTNAGIRYQINDVISKDIYGGGNVYVGLEEAIKAYKYNGAIYGRHSRNVILMTTSNDIDNIDYDEVSYKFIVEEANKLNIRVFTVNVDSGNTDGWLEKISNETDGKYYSVGRTEVKSAFDDILKETRVEDRSADSNNDGISDYHSELIKEGKLTLFDGSTPFAGIDFSLNADYDGDGIKNGDEMIIKLDPEGYLVMFLFSDPIVSDADLHDPNYLMPIDMSTKSYIFYDPYLMDDMIEGSKDSGTQLAKLDQKEIANYYKLQYKFEYKNVNNVVLFPSTNALDFSDKWNSMDDRYGKKVDSVILLYHGGLRMLNLDSTNIESTNNTIVSINEFNIDSENYIGIQKKK